MGRDCYATTAVRYWSNNLLNVKTSNTLKDNNITSSFTYDPQIQQQLDGYMVDTCTVTHHNYDGFAVLIRMWITFSFFYHDLHFQFFDHMIGVLFCSWILTSLHVFISLDVAG